MRTWASDALASWEEMDGAAGLEPQRGPLALGHFQCPAPGRGDFLARPGARADQGRSQVKPELEVGRE